MITLSQEQAELIEDILNAYQVSLEELLFKHHNISDDMDRIEEARKALRH